MLEIQKIEPGSIKDKNLKIFVYGKSFVGKTTFASTFPKEVFILSTDGNYTTLDEEVYAVTIPNEFVTENAIGQKIKVSGWVAFKHYVNELASNPNYDGFQTVIVDLIKDIYDMCRDHVLSREGATHESEVKGRGKVWDLLNDEFVPVIRTLMTLDKNVVVIANEKETEGYVVPDTINSLTIKLMKYSTLSGRIFRKPPKLGQTGDGEVVLTCTSTFNQEGGNRLKIGSMEIESPTYQKLIDVINKVKKGE